MSRDLKKKSDLMIKLHFDLRFYGQLLSLFSLKAASL